MKPEKVRVKIDSEKECVGVTDFQGRHYKADEHHEVVIPKSAAAALQDAKIVTRAGRRSFSMGIAFDKDGNRIWDQ